MIGGHSTVGERKRNARDDTKDQRDGRGKSPKIFRDGKNCREGRSGRKEGSRRANWQKIRKAINQTDR